MNILMMVLIVLSVGSIIVMYSVITVCSTMAIVAIYYSFIKRIKCAGMLSRTLEMLNLRHFMRDDEREIKEQRTPFNVKAYLASFKESLPLSRKDYKRILIFSLIVFVFIFVPFAFSITMEAIKVAQGMDIKQLMHNGSGSFIFYTITAVLMVLVIGLVVFSLPVILIFYGILNQRVKRKIKKLEKLA